MLVIWFLHGENNMSFTIFDIHSVSALAAFRGFNNAGYVLFSDKATGELFYKAFNSTFDGELTAFNTALIIPKKDVSFYANPYLREIYCIYTTYDDDIYAVIFEEAGNKMIIKYPDVKIISGGIQPLAVYDAYAQCYMVYYIKLSDNFLYQALFDPYDTFKSELIIDTSTLKDTNPTLGSDFRIVDMATTQLTPLNQIYNLYALQYDNTANESKIR
jgi:hypothetical protein